MEACDESGGRRESIGCLCDGVFGISLLSAVAGAIWSVLVFLLSRTYFRPVHDDLGEEAYGVAIEHAVDLATCMLGASVVVFVSVVVETVSMFIVRRRGGAIRKLAGRVFTVSFVTATVGQVAALLLYVFRDRFFDGLGREFGEQASYLGAKPARYLAIDMEIGVVMVYFAGVMAAACVVAHRKRARR